MQILDPQELAGSSERGTDCVGRVGEDLLGPPSRLMKKDFEDEHHAKSILLWRSPGKIDSANGEMRLGVCVRMPRGPAVSDFFNSLLGTH